MALRDSSGRITIDEYAAQQDIRKINQAIAALESAGKAMDNLINQASTEQGQTAGAIVEKATELRKQISSMIGRLNETGSFISNTVAHYQELDRLMKEAIQSSMNPPSAGAATPAASSQPAATPSAPKPGSAPKQPAKKDNKEDFFGNLGNAISDAFKDWF